MLRVVSDYADRARAATCSPDAIVSTRSAAFQPEIEPILQRNVQARNPFQSVYLCETVNDYASLSRWTSIRSLLPKQSISDGSLHARTRRPGNRHQSMDTHLVSIRIRGAARVAGHARSQESAYRPSANYSASPASCMRRSKSTTINFSWVPRLGDFFTNPALFKPWRCSRARAMRFRCWSGDVPGGFTMNPSHSGPPLRGMSPKVKSIYEMMGTITSCPPAGLHIPVRPFPRSEATFGLEYCQSTSFAEGGMLPYGPGLQMRSPREFIRAQAQ